MIQIKSTGRQDYHTAGVNNENLIIKSMVCWDYLIPSVRDEDLVLNPDANPPIPKNTKNSKKIF